MKPLILIILDGWGIAQPGPGNAISQITTQNIVSYWNTFPHTQLLAAGPSVGLPDGEPGDSETGHMNIGAGKIVEQDQLRISSSIKDGSFFSMPAFHSAIGHCKKNDSVLHIIGLLSDTGVHASFHHLGALAKLILDSNLPRVYLHVCTDGRDSPPHSAIQTLENVYLQYPVLKNIQIGTVMGRYYGMDRDRRWDRTEKAYDALTGKAPHSAHSFNQAIEEAYGRGETDEFIMPTTIMGTPRISSKDSVIFYNYRIDRPRQLTQAFCLANFEKENFPDTYSDDTSNNKTNDPRAHAFIRKNILSDLFFVTMTQYRHDLPCAVAYPPVSIQENLSKVISDHNLRQLHIAESEKERFVTYYFNGMTGIKYPQEVDITIASSDIGTYDKEPEMKAREISDFVIDAINSSQYDFVVVNYANPDMVGHSGDIKKTVNGCETVDREVKRLVDDVLLKKGLCVITSDHGHAEEMLSPKNEVQTEHTSNPVPCIICCNEYKNKNITLPPGVLGDIAPTLLHMMNIPQPVEMTGRNLLSGVV